MTYYIIKFGPQGVEIVGAQGMKGPNRHSDFPEVSLGLDERNWILVLAQLFTGWVAISPSISIVAVVQDDGKMTAWVE